jgi:hypothetical protein
VAHFCTFEACASGSRNPTTILELSAPSQRQSTSENNDASATVPAKYAKNWLVYIPEKTANLKNGVRYRGRLTHLCPASVKTDIMKSAKFNKIVRALMG